MAALVTAAALAGVRSFHNQMTVVVAVTGAVKGVGVHAPLTVTATKRQRMELPLATESWWLMR